MRCVGVREITRVIARPLYYYQGVRPETSPCSRCRKREQRNVRFYPTAAQREGFRACKRCQPDTVPGSPEWDVRAVGRAMWLIADGVVDREGIAGDARRLGRLPVHGPWGEARRPPTRRSRGPSGRNHLRRAVEVLARLRDATPVV